MKLLMSSCLLSVFLLLSNTEGLAQSTSWKGTTNNLWNNPSNWTNGIPDNTKDAILGDAFFTGVNQPKINVVAGCRSITIGGVTSTTLTFTKTLTVSGNFTINSNGVAIQANTTTYLAGNFINNGLLSSNLPSSRVIFDGINQTISGTSITTFRRMTINAGCTLTLAKNIIVDSVSSILAVHGVLNPGLTYTVRSTGLTRIYDGGKIQVNAANFSTNYVLTGATTLYGGSIVEYSGANQVVSSAYSYSTLLLSGTGTKSLTANLPLLYGKNVSDGKILINSGIIFNLGIYTASRAVAPAGGELNIANGAFLKVGGATNFPANFATRVFGLISTVEYNGADQAVSTQNYGNLLFSTVGIKTSTAGFNVMGNLTINNGTLNTNTAVVNHNVAGNMLMTAGSFTGTNYTYTLNGTSDQNITLSAAIARLTINKTSGKVIPGADLNISSSLNFTKGIIQTGNLNVVIPASGTVTGAAQNTGWVNGNLNKQIVSGAAITKTFEIGDVSYAPVSVNFANVATAGNLVAKTIATDQAEINYSGIDPAKSVNRYWTFNNQGIVFTNATATFNWVASDIDAGAVTNNFKTGIFNGANWMLPSVNSPMATSIIVTGITYLGDFAVGEKLGKSIWTGDALTSDWFTPKNWMGLVPSGTDPTVIPNGVGGGRLYPIVSSGIAVVNDISIENTASLEISGGTLQIAGSLVSSSNLNAVNGTITYNGSAAQTISSNSFFNNTISNLNINNDVSLADVIKLKGTLTVANGKIFTTNNYLVLNSDSIGTARIASLPVDGSGNATAYVTGNVSIERFIPARKAWRLLSAPIKATAATTIADAWQEDGSGSSFVPNSNPNPGYGVHITGGTSANGFDQSPTNYPSLKVFNNATNSFVALPPIPGTFAKLNSYTGYMVYIRGDRGIDLSQGNSADITSTTLRVKGEINTGNITSQVNATNFSVLANPYPSAIDFGTITRTNVKNSFYVWDPKLGGAYGLGGYVAVSWNSSTGVYDVAGAASPVSQYIASGEAILVESLDNINPGSITVKESDKTNNGSDFVFGRQAVSGRSLRINLYSKNADEPGYLLDGALITYASNNNNLIDKDDFSKLPSGSAGISLQRAGKLLAIERRKSLSESDTSFINLDAVTPQGYKLQIVTENLDKEGLQAFLKDNFDGSINNTALNTNGVNEILFTVTTDPASSNPSRFSIVYSKQQTPGFSFRSIKAAKAQQNILVEWQVENENGIIKYEIESSTDGKNFVKASAVPVKTNHDGTFSYSWYELNAADGAHYYKVKPVAARTSEKYSDVASVVLANTQPETTLILYPNPVKNNTVTLQLGKLEKGNYQVEVFNLNGQLVKRIAMQHTGGELKYILSLNENLPTGKYQVKLSGSVSRYITSMIKE